MMDAKDPRRKARTIMATDSEWARIGERAKALDMPISRFVVQLVLATTAPQFGNAGTTPDDDTMTTPPVLPSDLQWRLAHHVMVLARLERHRFESAGHGEAWQAIEEEVQSLLEAEGLLDGKGSGR